MFVAYSLLLQHVGRRRLLGKVREDECSFLRWQLVLFLSGLFQQLFPHYSEH